MLEGFNSRLKLAYHCHRGRKQGSFRRGIQKTYYFKLVSL